MKISKAAMLCAALAFAVGCGGGGGMSGNSSLTLSLANSSAAVYQGQAAVVVNVSLARTGSVGNVTLSVTGLPSGASNTTQSPGSGNSGSISFSAATSAAPGSYPLTITASDGTLSGTGSLSLTVGAAAVIAANQTGPFSLAMSTSFQPAEWDYQFFQTNPGATTTLGNLGPHHVRLQGISQGIPQGTEDSASTAWNFTILDGITQPVLGVGDHSPEFQIAKGPAFMYENNDFNSTFVDQTYAEFAGYAQNLVQYYNTGGFTANGQTHVSPSADKITWWGIYNEPNINNDFAGTPERPDLYVKMYNEVVPAMQAIDPTIKFAAVELADFQGQVQAFIPTFVSGVTAQVDALATHFYSTCDQTTPDVDIFNSVATTTGGNFNFVSDVQQIYADLAQNDALKSVPIWVTENNVNADYDAGNGMSACNPNQKFVDDLRGSSPFFAAWRPYVFSQFGKNGVQALYHWDFEADPQFGEVADANGALQLSYWVDYELGQIFPPTAGSKLLGYVATDDSELETLPVINGDNSVVIMVANHGINSPSDNNGPGVPRSVLIDVSALGTFSTASLLTIDKNTDVSNGPVAAGVTVAPQIPVTLNGYSVAFLTLKP